MPGEKTPQAGAGANASLRGFHAKQKFANRAGSCLRALPVKAGLNFYPVFQTRSACKIHLHTD
jgi:hypothetical protein